MSTHREGRGSVGPRCLLNLVHPTIYGKPILSVEIRGLG